MEAKQLVGTVVAILAGEDGERGLDDGGSGADREKARLFVVDDGKDNFDWFGGSEGWSDGAPATGVPRSAGEGRWNSILLIKVLQNPKIVDKVLQEPNIVDKVLQEPNIVDKVLQEPNIVNKVLQKPKIVDKVL
ncbi:hypothetical protein T459_08496 [Capsicum annuum]|uniref:Uncharacterized protein n=1 Tax=Capsicum annuum TaxID=4072 RepID=A0A2G2ZWM2_CAPAN|nr:hypothetical protein T459_08496 [Capsicum annuum]